MKRLFCLMLMLFFITGCGKDSSSDKTRRNTSASNIHSTANANVSVTTTKLDAQTNDQDIIPPDSNSSNAEQVQKTSNILKIHYIDVGNADSILVQAPDGKNLLIDGGDTTSDDLLVSYLRSQYINTLDYILVTHPHENHLGGLDSVINNFNVLKLYMPTVGNSVITFNELLHAAAIKNLKTEAAKASVKFDLGESIEAVLLAPISTTYDYIDDYSAVLKITYGATSFLFTGDADEASQMQILSSGASVKSDVLKVPANGGYNALHPDFLNAVSPSCAVVFAGKNINGYPYYNTLNTLNNAGIKIYRTDDAGTITASSDGSNITFDKEPVLINEQSQYPVSQP